MISLVFGPRLAGREGVWGGGREGKVYALLMAKNNLNQGICRVSSTLLNNPSEIIIFITDENSSTRKLFADASISDFLFVERRFRAEADENLILIL